MDNPPSYESLYGKNATMFFICKFVKICSDVGAIQYFVDVAAADAALYAADVAAADANEFIVVVAAADDAAYAAAVAVAAAADGAADVAAYAAAVAVAAAIDAVDDSMVNNVVNINNVVI
jgi:hypothetical protein